MTRAAAILARPTLARRGRATPGAAVVNTKAALDAGFDEVLAVVTDVAAASGLPDGVTVLLDEAGEPDEASSLRVATDWCARMGHHDVVVAALFEAAPLEAEAWRRLAEATGTPVVLARNLRGRLSVARLEAGIFSLLPLEGRVEVLWRSRPELMSELAVEVER